MLLRLLHLCDTLFPLGGFAYSDGLETATAWTSDAPTGGGAARVSEHDGPAARATPDARHGLVTTRRVQPASDDERPVLESSLLGSWMDVCLDETIGRLEGPAVWRAWLAVLDGDWDGLARLDEEVIALRPASGARRSSRAMGRRLLTTWQTLYPDARIAQAVALSRRGRLGPALPIAFAAACAGSGIDRRAAVEAFAYTRLAATISAAMRLLPIGQGEAHRQLARALDLVAAIAGAIETRNAAPESFAPALDIAAMSQQYLHSRLFRS
jgi:urease accessory protein UreF